ncbi:MAG: P-type conjugative transfer protein TrbG [Betaproteobacteria bacterium]|nr:P-type conjugative transfer protein TrbG [Betaproteobacteria bacterium]
MKTNYVVAMLALSLVGSAAGQAQQATNGSPTQSPTPAEPPPAVVKREPVPSPAKYPLAEAVRALESGDPPGNGAAKHAPTVPAVPANAAPAPVSPEVPRDFEAKRDVALNATGVEAVVLSREWVESRNAPAPGKDGRVVYAYGGGLPIVVCAPLHVCILELEPGEKVLGEPHIGDSIRWEISPSVSGSGPDATPLIIIKPRIAGLDTTMVVPTDRRAYYVRLESKPNEYVARVAFSYPEDTKQKWQEYLVKERGTEQQAKAAAERVAELPNTALENMYWNYEIKGGDVSARPVHVIDDGAKTYIQMPVETIHREVPVLVVKGPNGSEMVNYRVKDNMYIVDRLFDRAALLLGSGKHQTKVELIRKVEVSGRKTHVQIPQAQPASSAAAAGARP